MSRLAVAAAGIALAVCVGGCGAFGVDGNAGGKPSYTDAPPTPTLDPARRPASVTHGTPYSTGEIRDALAASRSRIPPELASAPVAAAIAEALAAQISTYDGQPYRELELSGSCDDDGARCDLQAKGLPSFAADRDVADFYTYSVEVATGVLSPAGEPALRGFPPELAADLDAAVRSLLADRLAGKSLLGVQWAPAPPADGYVLRYGTGDEEADEQVVVRYDRGADRAVVVGD